MQMEKPITHLGKWERRRLRKRLRQLWAAPLELLPSTWAEKYRVLDRGASAEPGKFSCDRLPWQRGIMDAVVDKTVTDIVAIGASQTMGKTEILNNIVGYFIHHDPASILVAYPTLQTALTWSRKKFAKMVQSTPVLRAIIGTGLSGKKTAGQTQLSKEFAGGGLAIAGSNSPSTLRGQSCRIVLGDEIDAWATDSGGEGDPVELAAKRCENFQNAIRFWSSTPTRKGSSRIARKFEESDQHYWHVNCPHCQHEQVLKWDNLVFENDKPAEAKYLCESAPCRKEWTDAQRIRAILNGKWVAHNPGSLVRGFHLSGLYKIMGKKRAFRSYLHEFAAGYIKARAGGTEAYMAWVNTFLAEAYEDAGEVLTADPLLARREDYSTRKSPAGVLRVVCGIDTQDDRWEAELVGYGLGEETWGLGRLCTSAAPGTRKAADELDIFLSTRFEHPSGGTIEVSRAFMDAGGHHSKDVYDYCRAPHRTNLVMPCHGSTRRTAPPVNSKPKKTIRGCKLYEVGTSIIKDSIYARLKSDEVGPGYQHFPLDPHYDGVYFAQLTAERRVTRTVKGVNVSTWEKPNGVRNEALDIRVYAAAAFTSLLISNKTLEEDAERNSAAILKNEIVEQLKNPEQQVMKPKLPGASSGKITRADLEAMKVVPVAPAPKVEAPVTSPEKPAEQGESKPEAPGLPKGGTKASNSTSRWKQREGWAKRPGHGGNDLWRPML
jgi:phage terminase large subunit GpA-like protein